MKLSELELANEPNHKVLEVLNILLQGKSVKVDNYEIMMAKTINDSYKPVILIDNGDVLGMDFTLDYFISLASKVSDDEISVKVAEIVLAQNNKAYGNETRTNN